MRIILLLGIIFPLFIIAQNEKKIALIIGNKNYVDPSAELTNPLNDSDLMKNTFEKLNFDSVIIANDLNYDQMKSAFSSYRTALRGDFNIGFIYYSGHGTQDQYQNSFLIPIDFPKNPTITDVEDKAYDFTNFITQLERIENKLHVIILDACRNNPFEKGWKGKSATGTGLSVPKETVDGILIHYSTTAGKTASDNTSLKNSLYTQILSEELLVPNQEIESIFKSTKKRVMEESKKLGIIQSPKSYGNWVGNLTLLRKKDYSKIEIKDLNKEAEEAKKNGDTELAIKKYSTLQNYFESTMQNIDKNKLVLVYRDMGEIYLTMAENFYNKMICEDNWTDVTKEEYNQIRLKSSQSFLNAKLLLEEIGLKDKNDKIIFSETFYKYLRIQSYLNWGKYDNLLNDSLFAKNINELSEFNKSLFGENDFRTASSLYLKGLFYKEINLYESFNSFNLSSKSFENSRYNRKDLKNYTMSHLVDYYCYDWTLRSINDMLKFVFDEINNNDEEIDDEKVIEKFEENWNINFESIHYLTEEIVNKGMAKALEISKKCKNEEDCDGDGIKNNCDKDYKTNPTPKDILEHASNINDYLILVFGGAYDRDKKITFADYEKFTEKSIEYNKKMLEYSKIGTYENFKDSVRFENESARKYLNLGMELNLSKNALKTDVLKCKELHEKALNLRQSALKRALRAQDNERILTISSDIVGMYSDYHTYWYQNHDEFKELYKKEKVKEVLSKLNDLFTGIMAEARNDKSQYFDWWSNNLLEYINDFETLDKKGCFSYENESDLEYLEICADQNNSVQMYVFGYGHQDVLNSYNDQAIFYHETGQYEKAKNKYIEIIEKTDYHSKAWTESDKSIYKGYEIENIKLFLKANAFYNYSLLITKNFKKEYSNKDRETIDKWEDFLNKNKKQINTIFSEGHWEKYQEYLFKSKVFVYWYEKKPEEVISLMDYALEMFDLLLKQKKDKNGNRNGRSQFQIEDAINWFYDNKAIKVEQVHEKPTIINLYSNYLKSYKKWKAKDMMFPTLEAYDKLCWIYNNEKDWKNLRKTSTEAFKIGSEFIEKDDFSYFSNPEWAKGSIMQQTGNFIIWNTEHFSKPSVEDREKAISFFKKIESYYTEKSDSVEVNSDAWGFDDLMLAYYYLADQNYWLAVMKNDKEYYQKSLDYSKKQLKMAHYINDPFEKYAEIINASSTMIEIAYWLNDKNLFLDSYKDYLVNFLNNPDSTKYINTSYSKENIESVLINEANFSCTRVNKNLGLCTVPFLNFKITTRWDEKPCLEFDVDHSGSISNGDKRYYVTSSDTLKVENINKIDFNISGYHYVGVNIDGIENDVSPYIFFEKNNEIPSSSFIVEKKENVDGCRYETCSKTWSFWIPESEINPNNSKNIELLINFISKSEKRNTYGRTHTKNTIPLIGRLTGFEDTYQIEIKN